MPLIGDRPLKSINHWGFAFGWTTVCTWFTIPTLLISKEASHLFERWMWANGLLARWGIKVTGDGLHHLDPQRPYILMANHRSLFDILAIFRTYPTPVRFVAKQSLFYTPWFGWHLSLGGYIPIDRRNRRQAIASLDRAAATIRAGTTIVAFPEGSRSPDETVMPFKKGPFMLALKAGVPIVPVSISGSGTVMDRFASYVTTGHIRVRYGEPIPTEGLTVDDRDGLMERVREAMVRNKQALDAEAASGCH